MGGIDRLYVARYIDGCIIAKEKAAEKESYKLVSRGTWERRARQLKRSA